jgi:outer membrane receptor protein involved in Fe transport
MSKSKKLGWFMLSGASLAAMGALSPAMAQDDVSEEIVVTATGRAAAIQDVPLAVTAVGGETLENTGARDLRDITQVAPSLNTFTGQSNTSSASVYIRGIGTGTDNPGFEGAVGIFIDGVYRARAGAALADLPELERVEVLRGPQGTLFGRNTSAGAISVVTAGPEFEPGMYLETTFGLDDLEETGARAGVNVPVGDNLAFRLDGSVRARDGYIIDQISGDDINDRNRWSARGQAVWDISNDASLRVIVDAAETDEACCATTPFIAGSTDLAIASITGNPPQAIDPEGRETRVTPGRGFGEQVEEWGISGQLNWDIGDLTLTSITAYRDWDSTRDQDTDFGEADIAYRDGLVVNFENYTQEFRLQGEWGRVNWLVGVFYGDETLDTTDHIQLGADANAFVNANALGATGRVFYDLGGPNSVFGLANAALNGVYLDPNVTGQGQQNDHWVVDTESISLFTHNEISLTDALVLTVGVRYNHETKDLTGDLVATSDSCDSLQGVEFLTGAVSGLEGAGLAALLNLACNPAINPIANSALQPGGVWTGDSEENEWSGTLSLAYHMTDDMMVYGGYSRGYKAGGFNVDRSGFSLRPSTIDPTTLSIDQLHFAPEFTDAYEFGLKSTIFGGTTTLNAALFYQQIHDYQLNSFNGFNFITRNIPEAISQGAELEISARPTDNLTLSGGVVYTDAYYDSTVNFLSPLPDPTGLNTITPGTPFSFAPEVVVTAGVNYEMPVTSSLNANFYLDARWNDGYTVQTLNRNPATDNEAFAIFNGRIRLSPESEHWSVELWGRNLFDEFYRVGAFSPPLQNNVVIYPSEPQTYGITLRLRN